MVEVLEGKKNKIYSELKHEIYPALSSCCLVTAPIKLYLL